MGLAVRPSTHGDGSSCRGRAGSFCADRARFQRQYACAGSAVCSNPNPGETTSWLPNRASATLSSNAGARSKLATACLGKATYAITWRTYLQSSFTEGDRHFHQIMAGCDSDQVFQRCCGDCYRVEAEASIMRRLVVLAAPA